MQLIFTAERSLRSQRNKNEIYFVFVVSFVVKSSQCRSCAPVERNLARLFEASLNGFFDAET